MKPPAISPMMLARPMKLVDTPCTAPWYSFLVVLESMDISEGHINPLPTAKKTNAQYVRRSVPKKSSKKLMRRTKLPKVRSAASEYLLLAHDSTGPSTTTSSRLSAEKYRPRVAAFHVRLFAACTGKAV